MVEFLNWKGQERVRESHHMRSPTTIPMVRFFFSDKICFSNCPDVLTPDFLSVSVYHEFVDFCCLFLLYLHLLLP